MLSAGEPPHVPSRGSFVPSRGSFGKAAASAGNASSSTAVVATSGQAAVATAAPMKQPPLNHVQTLLRLRPTLPTECTAGTSSDSQTAGSTVNDDPVELTADADPSILRCCADGRSLEVANSRNEAESFRYTFDRCFDGSSGQAQVFDAVLPTLSKVFDERNVTIFTYGITGAGKTYTMDGTPSHPGIIPRAIDFLFQRARELSAPEDGKLFAPIFKWSMSHLEIYNEKVLDLMMARSSSVTAAAAGASIAAQDLQIRQDALGNIHVADLTETPIKSVEEFEQCYKQSRINRSTASTLLNSSSSRSHSVLTISLCKVDRRANRRTTTKLNLIDLAGSEDNRKTGNNKDRMVESGNINRSLFMLSQVVDALNSGASNVPYRNSKLTRLLQDSLGGRAVSMMIVNVAPGKRFYLDTLNSLNIARKARSIVNRPTFAKPEPLTLPAPQPRVQTATKIVEKRPSDVSKTALVKPATAVFKKPAVPTRPAVTTSQPPVDILTWEALLPHATPGTKRGIMKAVLHAKAKDAMRAKKKRSPCGDASDYDSEGLDSCSEYVASELDGGDASEEDDDDEDVVVRRRPAKKLRRANGSAVSATATALARRCNSNNTIDDVFPSPMPHCHGGDENTNTAASFNRPSNASTLVAETTPVPTIEQELLCDTTLLALLNEGNVKRITSLRGIGLVRAKTIIDHRLEHGVFEEMDVVRKVLGEKVVANIRRDLLEKIVVQQQVALL